jgi:AcrR family transcriptional regulator
MTRAKRTRRPEARPDEILDAALKVFTEKGFAAARVEDVAKAAGLSKGAVYLYFDSKEALFEALVRRFAEHVAANAAKRFLTLAEADPETAIRGGLRFLMGMMSDPAVSAAPRLVIAEAQRFPAIAALYHREVVSIGRRAIEALLARGVERGVFRAVPAEAAKRCVMGPMLAHLFLTQIFVDPNDPTPPPDPEATADAVADILLNGLRPRSSPPQDLREIQPRESES